MTHPNLDLVNEKVYTKFGFKLSICIRSQETERKPNCVGMTERKRMTERVNPLFQSRALELSVTIDAAAYINKNPKYHVRIGVDGELSCSRNQCTILDTTQ